MRGKKKGEQEKYYEKEKEKVARKNRSRREVSWTKKRKGCGRGIKNLLNADKPA